MLKGYPYTIDTIRSQIGIANRGLISFATMFVNFSHVNIAFKES
jgi:hypothetical protein